VADRADHLPEPSPAEPERPKKAALKRGAQKVKATPVEATKKVGKAVERGVTATTDTAREAFDKVIESIDDIANRQQDKARRKSAQSDQQAADLREPARGSGRTSRRQQPAPR
jgi:hypothetical protein